MNDELPNVNLGEGFVAGCVKAIADLWYGIGGILLPSLFKKTLVFIQHQEKSNYSTAGWTNGPGKGSQIYGVWVVSNIDRKKRPTSIEKVEIRKPYKECHATVYAPIQGVDAELGPTIPFEQRRRIVVHTFLEPQIKKNKPITLTLIFTDKFGTRHKVKGKFAYLDSGIK